MTSRWLRRAGLLTGLALSSVIVVIGTYATVSVLVRAMATMRYAPTEFDWLGTAVHMVAALAVFALGATGLAAWIDNAEKRAGRSLDDD